MNSNDKQSLFLTVVVVATLVVAIVGASFAYFNATISGNNNVVTQSFNFAVTLSVSKVAPTDATFDKLIPLSIGDIGAAVTGYDDGETTPKPCVDKKGYAACVIYDLAFTNNSGYSVTLDGSLTPVTNGFSSGQLYYRVSTANSAAGFTDVGLTSTHITNSAVTTGFTNITVGTAGTTHLYLLMYILNDPSNDQPNDTGKTFSGRLTFTDQTSSDNRLQAEFS